jgi:hypothetical protein
MMTMSGKVSVEVFFSVLDGFKRLNQLVDAVRAYKIRKNLVSKRLHDLTTEAVGFPTLSPLLEYFTNAIDRESSEKRGK